MITEQYKDKVYLAHLHSSVGEYLSPDTAEPIHEELYIDNPM